MKIASVCIHMHLFAPLLSHMQPSVPKTHDSTRPMLQKARKTRKPLKCNFYQWVECRISMRIQWHIANLTGLKICKSSSKCNTNESETINKMTETRKSQNNQANRLLRYAIRSQIAPRIQCRIPNQPKSHICNEDVCKNRGRRQRRSLQITPNIR